MKINLCAFRCGFSLILILAASFAVSHEGHHSAKQELSQAPVGLQEANDSYLQTIKPIFQRACFDCHSSNTNFPWYSSLPLAKQLIIQDIEEAKEHLDMSNDFPFSGHGSPVEDLEAIGKVVNEGTMPPLRYRVLHYKNKLNEQDKKLISEWVSKSLSQLHRSESKHK